MSLKILRFAATIVLGVMFMGGVLSSGPAWALSSPTRGVISGLDPDAKTVEIIRKNEEKVTFQVTDETVVLINDEPGTLTDLKLKTKAEISFQEEEGKFIARWIRDQDTVALRQRESDGIEAVILNLQAEAGTLTVRTALEKERTLKLVPAGKNRSRVMKNGQPATLADFTVQEKVMVSIRRTSGATLYLKGLADPRTFLAFLWRKTVEGAVTRFDTKAETVGIQPAEGEAVQVALTRATRFYQGGQEVEDPTFAQGDEVIVVISAKVKGVARAWAIFDRESWGAYADAEIKARQEKAKKGEAEEEEMEEEGAEKE